MQKLIIFALFAIGGVLCQEETSPVVKCKFDFLKILLLTIFFFTNYFYLIRHENRRHIPKRPGQDLRRNMQRTPLQFLQGWQRHGSDHVRKPR